MSQPEPLGEDWVPWDTFGARLALIRQSLGGWNIKKAAEYCGITAQNWNRWEAGKSPREIHAIARQISDRTGCSYNWLVAGGAPRSRCFSTILGTFGQGVLFEDGGAAWSDRAALAIVSN